MTQSEEVELRQILQRAAQLGTPQERQRIAAEEHQAMLHREEDGKAHPLRALRLPDDQWADLVAHFTDGGGVVDSRMASKDGRPLDTIMHDALMNGDQETFWAELPHWFKSHLIMTGRVQRHSGGGVTSGPHGSLNSLQPAMVTNKHPALSPAAAQDEKEL